MARHIVAWRLAAESAREREAAVAGMRERIGSLVGVVPGLLSAELSTDAGRTPGNWDVVLVSEHATVADIDAYQVHPEHLRVAGWIRTVVSGRMCVDVDE
jgi:hypothetical protein